MTKVQESPVINDIHIDGRDHKNFQKITVQSIDKPSQGDEQDIPSSSCQTKGVKDES